MVRADRERFPWLKETLSDLAIEVRLGSSGAEGR